MKLSSSRVLLLGASGYTGRLTAVAMAKAGLRPLLVGRSRPKLEAVIGDILGSGAVAGGVATADVSDPASLRSIVEPGDIVVTTIGPFAQLGEPAIAAAISGGAAAYIDSTGEPAFIRRVFEEWGPQASASHTALLTAFGYDYVPGNLAAGLAWRDALESGAPPVRIDVGYFTRGEAAISGGTAASAGGALLSPSYEFVAGRLRTSRGANRWRTFDIDGRTWDGLAVGGTEQFALPRLSGSLTEVNVYLGWAGSRTRHVSRLSPLLGAVGRLPGAERVIDAVVSRTSPAPGDGPSADVRAKSRTLAVAEAFDGVGRSTARVVVEGPSPYDLTADLLTWAAANAHHLIGTGALGPVDGFGIDVLEAGCAGLGLRRVE